MHARGRNAYIAIATIDENGTVKRITNALSQMAILGLRACGYQQESTVEKGQLSEQRSRKPKGLPSDTLGKHT
ncbi:hypothetical protein DL89DRAFT_265086 [Linderina pennispora]|uniref:Uncharacterized protein n=1 Tax=Linderina pennispora TaxID=61395 RepID=A0A1Y1WHS2_9FUNG|nr:uncharacterized protein DL89DRAFT_265086 [Linderina pennispora]ORX72915.1 hypothetical protein DL89DRAFT_265086 [Linderina pennispora]